MNNNRIKKIIATIVFTALVGSVAFGWYTLSSESTATGMGFTAGAIGELKISKVAAGPAPASYGASIDFNFTGKVLNPVTTKDGKAFFAPVYSGKNVNSVKAVTGTDLTTNYIYEEKFYLKVAQGGAVADEYKIYLVSKGDGSGTYFTDNDAADDKDTAANAVRVSFTLGGTTVIYEPNSDISNSDTHKATDNVTGDYNTYTTVKQTKAGNFVDGVGNDSSYLFTVTANTNNLVTMRVWIEGKDVDCVNSIQLDQLTANFKFGAISSANVE